MTGLIDTFRRHFGVLTNFQENEVKSRPYGQEAAFARGAPGSARHGQDRAPEGWVRTSVGAVPQTTHSRVLQTLPGPASLSEAPLGRGRPWRWVTRYYPPWYTHPGTIPRPYTHPWTTPRPLAGHGTHCSYTRFWRSQGEPRGSRTHG